MKFHYSFSKYLTICLPVLIVGCSNLKPCGEPYSKCQRFFQSSKLKRALKQRDSLCESNASMAITLNGVNNLLDQKNSAFDSLKSETIRIEDEYEEYKTQSNNDQLFLNRELNEKLKTIEAQNEQLIEKQARMKEYEQLVQNKSKRLSDIQGELEQDLMKFDGLSVSKDKGKIRLELTDKLLFNSGSDKTGDKGIEALDAVAKSLNTMDVHIIVEGHTDNIPIKSERFRDNLDLSAARANAVVRVLLSKGVDSRKITSSARGDFEPIVDNSSEEGRAKNRRTELVLTLNTEQLNNLLELDQAWVEGVRIISHPESCDRYLVPMDAWNSIWPDSDDNIVSKLKINSNDWFVGNTNSQFTWREDLYMTVIERNGKIKYKRFVILLNKNCVTELNIEY